MNARVLPGPAVRGRTHDHGELAQDLAQDIAHTHKLAIDLGRALNHDLARDLALTLTHIHDLAWDGMLAPDLGSRLARDLLLSRALDLANASVRDLSRDGRRDLGVTLARELEQSVSDLTQKIARYITLMASVNWSPVRSTPLPASLDISGVAQRITDFAAWLLPAGYRTDKAEEFACELYDLAAAGQRRRRQLGHAVRVLIHVLPLYRELSRAQRGLDRG